MTRGASGSLPSAAQRADGIGQGGYGSGRRMGNPFAERVQISVRRHVLASRKGCPVMCSGDGAAN